MPDRIDILVELVPVPFRELIDQQSSEKREAIRDRVILAKKVQESCFAESKGLHCKAQMSSKQLRSICALDATGHTLIKTAMEKLNLSVRAYDRILKVSPTIANFDGSDLIKPEHLAEAIQYRSLDRGN